MVVPNDKGNYPRRRCGVSIRPVLGSRASIGGPLGSGRGGAAAAWYLAGGVSAANVIAVYQPIGAASLAASYTNLANPGTYTAAPGVAPTFDTATGWTFAAASSQYLDTGITYQPAWSVVVRFSDGTTSGTVRLFDVGTDKLSVIPGFSASSVYWNAGATANNRTPAMYSGVLAAAGNQPYRDGSADGATFTGTITSGSFRIAARNDTTRYFSGKIQALAIYNVTLDAAQVAAISSAMAAL